MAEQYRVVNQEFRNAMLEDGTVGEEVIVSFVVEPNETRASVRIPRKFYVPAYVHSAIQNEVDVIRAVEGL